MAQPLKRADPQQNISVRLPSPIVDLLDAWAVHLTEREHRSQYRADVIVHFLERAKPSAQHHSSEIIDAYERAFQ